MFHTKENFEGYVRGFNENSDDVSDEFCAHLVIGALTHTDYDKNSDLFMKINNRFSQENNFDNLFECIAYIFCRAEIHPGQTHILELCPIAHIDHSHIGTNDALIHRAKHNFTEKFFRQFIEYTNDVPQFSRFVWQNNRNITYRIDMARLMVCAIAYHLPDKRKEIQQSCDRQIGNFVKTSIKLNMGHFTKELCETLFSLYEVDKFRGETGLFDLFFRYKMCIMKWNVFNWLPEQESNEALFRYFVEKDSTFINEVKKVVGCMKLTFLMHSINNHPLMKLLIDNEIFTAEELSIEIKFSTTEFYSHAICSARGGIERIFFVMHGDVVTNQETHEFQYYTR